MATDPSKHLYVWTFTDKSWLMRYYLWVYGDCRDSLTFCKLFWGMICSPVTLPVRCAISVAKSVAAVSMMTVALFAKVPGLPVSITRHVRESTAVKRESRRLVAAQQRQERIDARTQARVDIILAQRAEEERIRQEKREKRWERDREEALAWAICKFSYAGLMQGPKPASPPKPSVPSKIADATATRVDKVVAFFQERPQIGQTVNRYTASLGQFFVHRIFYPLMVMVPMAAFSFGIYEVVMHRSGLTNAVSQSGSGLASAIWPAVCLGAPYIGMAIGGAIVASLVWVGAMWLVLKIEPRPITHARIPAPKTKSPILIAKEGSRVVYTKADKAFDRGFDGVAALGRGAGAGAKATVNLAMAFAGIFATFGKFFAMGHHSVKYRTCPRIEVIEAGDEE